MQRVVAGEQLIRNDGDAELLTRAVIAAAQKAGLELHAFSILPGDLRLLGTAQDITALSATMQGIARSYVAPFNRRHKRSWHAVGWALPLDRARATGVAD